jgi:GTPase SAR1 family protein
MVHVYGTMADDSEDKEVFLKFCVVGEEATGKTALCRSFVAGTSVPMTSEYIPTFGMDIYEKKITIGRHLKYLNCWER